jgi:hypothetical protein
MNPEGQPLGATVKNEDELRKIMGDIKKTLEGLAAEKPSKV